MKKSLRNKNVRILFGVFNFEWQLANVNRSAIVS